MSALPALPASSTVSASSLAAHNRDRHWRDARTHTLHDPVRWTYRAVGDWVLDGKRPPRHGAL